MVHGFVSPLDSITKMRSNHELEGIRGPLRPQKPSHTSKPFKMSPVIRVEGDEEDRWSLKHKQTDAIEKWRGELYEDDSLDEELMKTQHMSELSVNEEDDEDWYTLIGILILLISLFGVSSVGVVANLVPASSGFVQMA